MLQLTASNLIPWLQDPGTYVPGVFTSKADCIDCLAGYACAGGESQPAICLPGNIAPLSRPTADRAQCAKCAAGKFQEAEGATACDTCTAGSYCKQGASAALPCLSGSYSSTSGLGEASSCTDCPKGSACSTGSTAHVLCAPGTFADGLGSRTCIDCDGGTFQDAAGATACKHCIAGHFCLPAASTALPCPAGSFATSTSLSEASRCTPCPRGSFCPSGSTSPQDCGLATAAPDEGMPLCTSAHAAHTVSLRSHLGSLLTCHLPPPFCQPALRAPSRIRWAAAPAKTAHWATSVLQDPRRLFQPHAILASMCLANSRSGTTASLALLATRALVALRSLRSAFPAPSHRR